MTDPLQVVWNALERADCQPRGPLHSFRARCPVHNGENRDSLHVSLGSDGRALLFCHAHDCEPRAITAALGIGMPDLFPPGHRSARRRPLAEARRVDFQGRARTVANVLKALQTPTASGS